VKGKSGAITPAQGLRPWTDKDNNLLQIPASPRIPVKKEAFYWVKDPFFRELFEGVGRLISGPLKG